MRGKLHVYKKKDQEEEHMDTILQTYPLSPPGAGPAVIGFVLHRVSFRRRRPIKSIVDHSSN
jgi:hypothetical protein